MTREQELIVMLKTLKEQAQKSCKDTAILDVKKDSFIFVIDEAIQTIEQEPCEDAISRDELLKAIDTWDKFGCDANTKLVPYQDHYIPYIHYDDVVKCIKGMPSVTPQPKTGHWIHFASGDDCSECGWSTGKYISPSNYCPNCGAIMSEPQESEDKE